MIRGRPVVPCHNDITNSRLDALPLSLDVCFWRPLSEMLFLLNLFWFLAHPDCVVFATV